MRFPLLSPFPSFYFLGIEPRASCMLGKNYPTEIHLNPNETPSLEIFNLTLS